MIGVRGAGGIALIDGARAGASLAGLYDGSLITYEAPAGGGGMTATGGGDGVFGGVAARRVVVVVVVTFVTTSSPVPRCSSTVSPVSAGIAWTYTTEGGLGSCRNTLGKRILRTDAAGEPGAEATEAGRGTAVG